MEAAIRSENFGISLDGYDAVINDDEYAITKVMVMIRTSKAYRIIHNWMML